MTDPNESDTPDDSWEEHQRWWGKKEKNEEDARQSGDYWGYWNTPTEEPRQYYWF